MEKFEASDGLKKLQAADENSFLLRDDLFIIRSLKRKESAYIPV